MTIPRTTAREICTQAEFALVNASFPPDIKAIHPDQVALKAERARKLQDKYRQLARKQHRASKSAPGDRRAVTMNARTDKKARLFEETRVRYEKRARQLRDH